MNFSEPKKIPDGRYFVKVTSNTSSGRVLKQLNNVVLNTPFAEGDTVTISLPSAAVDQIKGVDLEILKAAEENSTAWFQKELKSQTLDAAFTKSLSDTSMNLSKMKNQDVKAYSASKELVDPNTFMSDTVCDVVVELVGIWFMKKTFGTGWRLVQMREKIPPKPKWNEQYLFQDEEQQEEEEDDYP